MYYHPNHQRDYEAAQERAQYLSDLDYEKREKDAEWVYNDLLAIPTSDMLKVLHDDLRTQVETALDAAARRIAGLL